MCERTALISRADDPKEFTRTIVDLIWIALYTCDHTGQLQLLQYVEYREATGSCMIPPPRTHPQPADRPYSF
jgi:hypothetical protein